MPWCITYTFIPDELEDMLKSYGVKNIKLAGPGAYARTLPNEFYDSNPYVCGMGKDNLFARGEL